jgi:hypothetical protein
MTSKEFVIWLKGYSDAIATSPTQAQWDTLKEKVKEVSDETTPSFPFGVPNTAPIQTLPFIQPYQTDPYNPYKVTCQQPDTNGTTITTTPNVGGSITIANPPFGFGTTSTAYGYPSGSAWSYTNGGKEKENGE